MNKPKLYKGTTLKGYWEITLKIDGVRAFWKHKGIVSRADKPLCNLPPMPLGTDAEVFIKNWETTVSRVRTHKGEEVSKEHIYTLDPLDPRLHKGYIKDPTPDEIEFLMERAVKEGYEGLVLRQKDRWLKVKPVETTDLVVTGLYEGKGKHLGRLGKVFTELGAVGTGFSDQQREDFWTEDFIGTTIEVEYMSLTPAGKMRHARFLRERFDK